MYYVLLKVQLYIYHVLLSFLSPCNVPCTWATLIATRDYCCVIVGYVITSPDSPASHEYQPRSKTVKYNSLPLTFAELFSMWWCCCGCHQLPSPPASINNLHGYLPFPPLFLHFRPSSWFIAGQESWRHGAIDNPLIESWHFPKCNL